MKKEVWIVAAKRTAIGSFGGQFASVSAPELGAAAISGVLANLPIDKTLIDEVMMGNVLSANLGQAPARQAAMFANLPNTVPCTTVNKVCASGMKAVMWASQTIALGDAEVVVAGGMESMSNVPHYLPTLRNGLKLGNSQLTDGLLKDGLWDVYNDFHMGEAGEMCAAKYGFTREIQDAFAIESYKRAARAWEGHEFDAEIIPVRVNSRNSTSLIATDEEYTRVDFDKIPKLRPVFRADGSITAANASTLNDGAAALVLMSAFTAKIQNISPMARIVAYADAAHEPEWFTTAPIKAMEKALAKSQLMLQQIEIFEINEAFSSVVLAAIHKLHLDPSRVNMRGGAVALGHPLGASGARILVTLTHLMVQKNAQYGMATLCNGGGGASAVILENMSAY